MNPEDALTIHRIKNEFPKSPWYNADDMRDLFNIQDVDVHRRWRRLLSHPLSESALKGVLSQVESNVRFAVAQIGKEMETRGVADVYKWWMCMGSDVIGELTFGESFGMLQKGEAKDVGTFAPIDVLMRWVVNWSIPTVLVPEGLMKILTLVPRLRGHGEELLTKYENRLTNDPKASPTLFTKIIQASEDDTLTRRELVDNAQLYIVAGADTTSNTLTYLTWQISRHPQMREKLVAEVKALPDDFHPQQLKDLPYLNQVISETLRLFSAVPAALPRVVPAGGAAIGDYVLPGGTTVATQAYSMHRNARVFEDPDKYDPDRWANPTKAMKDAFMPFGGGSRSCLGIHLAYHELRLATALFWRTFPNAVVSTKEGMSDEDMEQNLFFLMSPKGHRCLIEMS
ncbi:hypothetical protein SLS62_007931 [Diatrype stigma]|uniref:Cytochrome P450 n=1 Tax=Diatrype stigma TaxID=117547 RepID=A0AAN9ULB0_9PEZI